jgi:very-short-patch-repair endonuclease
MGQKDVEIARAGVWKLVEAQHGVVARRQLLELGLNSDAITHRLQRGRLHPIHRGVYALGRRDVSRLGKLMAAVLSCDPGAVLSHASAGELLGILVPRAGAGALAPAPIEISVPPSRRPRHSGVKVHQRTCLAPPDVVLREGIPVTSPIRTLLDLASRLAPWRLEAAINEADKSDLIDPETLRALLEKRGGEHGVPALRRVLDRHTFVLTDSELERRLLRIARRAGLPRPEAGVYLNGFKVDFFWRELALVVETDGLRYHRTAAQQARDRRRDQAHAAAGLTALRFTHAQVSREAGDVAATLRTVARRLRERSRRSSDP